REHCNEADDVDQDRRHVDSFYLDCRHDERDGADEPQTDADRMHHATGDDLSAVVVPADLPRTFAWRVHELQQLDNLLYAFYAVHRGLKDRMLFLDRQSRFFPQLPRSHPRLSFADPPGGEIGRSPCRRILPRHRSRSASRRAAAALVGGRDEASDQSRSTDLKVVRRLLAAITDNLIFDRLTLVERTKAGTLDSGDMDEHVSAAVLGLNEPIALGRVEPFDSASSHHRPP